MIHFDRIELTIYPNKPSDSVYFKAKDAPNSSSVRSNRFMEIFKKFEIRSADLIQFISVRFDFDLIQRNLRTLSI